MGRDNTACDHKLLHLLTFFHHIHPQHHFLSKGIKTHTEKQTHTNTHTNISLSECLCKEPAVVTMLSLAQVVPCFLSHSLTTKYYRVLCECGSVCVFLCSLFPPTWAWEGQWEEDLKGLCDTYWEGDKEEERWKRVACGRTNQEVQHDLWDAASCHAHPALTPKRYRSLSSSAFITFFFRCLGLIHCNDSTIQRRLQEPK